MRVIATLLAAITSLVPSLQCLGQDFKVFPAPVSGGHLVGLALGDDGSVWFTTGEGHSVGRMSADGSVSVFSLPPSAWPGRITRGPGGYMWFVNTSGSVGRISAAGVITEFVIPIPYAGPSAISYSPDGRLLVSGNVYAGGAFLAQVTADGKFQIQRWPGWGEVSSHSVGPDGSVWLARHDEEVLTRVYQDGTYCDVPFFRPQDVSVGRLRGVCAITLDSEFVACSTGSDDFVAHTVPGSPECSQEDASGTVWVTNLVQNALVAISPSGTVRSFPVPVPKAGPRAIALAPDGALWFVTLHSPSLVRFEPPIDGAR